MNKKRDFYYGLDPDKYRWDLEPPGWIIWAIRHFFKWLGDRRKRHA